MSTAAPSPAGCEGPDGQSAQRRLYSSAGDGLKRVQEDFLYWTGRLTDSSSQLSFALIAGNWAAFGSLQKILGNPWAKVSLGIVIGTLALTLLGAYLMGQLHCWQIEYAGKNPAKWEEEYNRSYGRDNPWPFTRTIERIGRGMRELKTWLPLVSGVCFLIALLRG